MKIKITLFVIVALILTGTGWYAYRTLRSAPGNTIATISEPQSQGLQRVQIVNGETVVMVGLDAQRASNIVVQPVTAAMDQPELTAYATVIDLQPLFDLRNRYAAARADRDSVRVHADASRLQYERTRILFQDDHNASEKSLQDAQVIMQSDQAKLQAAETMQNGLDAILRQQYGNALALAAVAAHSALSDRLLGGHAAIARVTLPRDSLASAPKEITIDGSDGQPNRAHKLSPSPLVDPAVQGNPYLYLVDNTLPIGMHTLAHVPLREIYAAGVSGFRIPEAAIVWYGGQSWAYVKTDLNHFTRRNVPNGPSTQRELFVTNGFSAGDKVVIGGAQLLLSEELRPQGIAAQQCKDPPECDD